MTVWEFAIARQLAQLLEKNEREGLTEEEHRFVDWLFPLAERYDAREDVSR